MTLNDFLPVVEAAASGMSHILKLQRGAIVGVFAKNCYQWSIVEHSASRMAYTLGRSTTRWAPLRSRSS